MSSPLRKSLFVSLFELTTINVVVNVTFWQEHFHLWQFLLFNRALVLGLQRSELVVNVQQLARVPLDGDISLSFLR